MKLLIIFLGGGLGSMARFGLGALSKMLWSGNFPAGTLIANLVSCMVLGLVLWQQQGKESDNIRSLVIIGFCGGLSTFSTFSFETLELFRNGHASMAIANVLISTLACILVLWFISKIPA